MAKKDTQKLQRQRLQVYTAHQTVHQHQVTRRRRDQWVAGAIMVVAVAAASLGYWAWSPAGEPEEDALAETSEIPADDPTEAEAEASDDTAATVPDIGLSEYRDWDAEMVIDGVPLELSLNGFLAPQAVANFLDLSRSGFFDGTSCHRLTTEGIFVLQCGDPEGTGLGGPDYRFGPIENAPEDDLYPAGTLAMARVGNDAQSMGSQFFIVWEDSVIPSDNAGGYTVFGEVTSGLEQLKSEVVDQGVQDDLTDGTPVAPAGVASITIR